MADKHPKTTEPYPTLDAARARIAALEQRDRGWIDLVAEFARDVNALASTFPDGNSHVLDNLRKRLGERDALAARVRALEAERDSRARMGAVDEKFHALAVKERDYERARVDTLTAERDALAAEAQALRAAFIEARPLLVLPDGRCPVCRHAPHADRDDCTGCAICRLVAAHEALPSAHAERVARLVAALAVDEPWPLLDVLEKLCAQAEHSLDDLNCDRDGWEGVRAAIDAAKRIAPKLRDALADWPGP